MARAVMAGDIVTIVRSVDAYVGMYGAAARQPFTVERIVRYPRYACMGGGMLVWRSLVKRVPREPGK